MFLISSFFFIIIVNNAIFTTNIIDVISSSTTTTSASHCPHSVVKEHTEAVQCAFQTATVKWEKVIKKTKHLIEKVDVGMLNYLIPFYFLFFLFFLNILFIFIYLFNNVYTIYKK